MGIVRVTAIVINTNTFLSMFLFFAELKVTVTAQSTNSSHAVEIFHLYSRFS